MPLPILRDPTGDPVPLGKVTLTLTGPDPGTVTTLPAWLDAASGTAEFPGAPDDWGVGLVTGAGTTDAASLATTFTLDSTRFRLIRWTVEGLHFDSDTTGASASIAVRNAADNSGVKLLGNIGSGDCTFRVLNPAGNASTALDYSWSDDEAPRRRTIGLELHPIDRRVYVLEGDQVVHAADVDASFVDGDLIPQVTITKSAGATNRWWRAAQVRLDLAHN